MVFEGNTSQLQQAAGSRSPPIWYSQVLAKCGPDEEVASTAQAEIETWTVLEYCGRGDLKVPAFRL